MYHTLSSSLKLRTTHLVLAALVLDTVGVPGLSTGRSCIGGAALMSTVIWKTFQILRKSKNTPLYWILFSLKNSTCIPTYKSFNKYPQNCKSLKPHRVLLCFQILMTWYCVKTDLPHYWTTRTGHRNKWSLSGELQHSLGFSYFWTQTPLGYP